MLNIKGLEHVISDNNSFTYNYILYIFLVVIFQCVTLTYFEKHDLHYLQNAPFI